MSFMNEKKLAALNSGIFPCERCGEPMEWETEREDILVCPHCGYSVDWDQYGFTDEEYEDLYPTYEELMEREGIFEEDDEDDENPEGEFYEEVYDELS